MGLTGWIMPDGKFFPCGRCEHRQTLTGLLFGDYSRYRLSVGSALREPLGAVCLHDTDFKYASFEGDMTEEVKEFLVDNFDKLSEEQKDCVRMEFIIQFGKDSTKLLDKGIEKLDNQQASAQTGIPEKRIERIYRHDLPTDDEMCRILEWVNKIEVEE